MSGLFSTFNIAVSGMNVQQKAIDITSHNVSNANTDGYSRQRAIIETNEPYTAIGEAGQIGTGASVTAVQRVRNSFLDYQIRVETSTQGTYQARDTYLSDIENIFNEPSDTGMSTLIGNFFNSWQDLSKQPQSSNARTVVAQQSVALANGLNHTYDQLEKLKTNAQSEIKDTVFQINDLLNQLDDVNQQIVGVTIGDNEANDLMDKRDNLLDKLSAQFNINVSNDDFSGINVSPADTNGMMNPNVVQSKYNKQVNRFSYISNIDTPTFNSSTGKYDINVIYYRKGDTGSENNKSTITLTGIDASNVQSIQQQLDEGRVLWSDSEGYAVTGDGKRIENGSKIDYNSVKLFQPSAGELKGYMSVQTDIDNYVSQLNNLAKTVAYTVNAVHSGQTSATYDSLTSTQVKTKDSNGNYVTVNGKDYMPFFVNNDVASKSYDLNGNINSQSLDSVLEAESGITAGNISVNQQIVKNVMNIKTRTNDSDFAYEADNNVDGNTDGARALAIAQLRNTLIAVPSMGQSIQNRADLFSSSKGGAVLTNKGLGIKNNLSGMTMDNYFKDTIDKLGVQEQEAKKMVTNQETLLNSYTESKNATSGVSLDEEMANLVQFQHAYQANAKVIATVDQLLDVVVNGLMK